MEKIKKGKKGYICSACKYEPLHELSKAFVCPQCAEVFFTDGKFKGKSMKHSRIPPLSKRNSL